MNANVETLAEMSRERIERGSKSFAAAASLFPPKMRESAYMLYAWCRYCDDVVDGQELGFRTRETERTDLPSDPIEIVSSLRERTIAACRGNPDAPVFEALTRVVERHNIPERHPLELIDGFAMDANDKAYNTLEDTLVYSYHVAGVVGLMMAYVMGVSERATLLRASDLGIAFQLTNISRDVIDDAELGRIYLPKDWLDEAGVDQSAIAEPSNRHAVATVVHRLLDEADQYYKSATVGIGELAFRPAMAIAAARSVYRAIGTEVRTRGDQAWDSRTFVSKNRKIYFLAASPFAVLQARLKGGKLAPSRDALWTPSLD